MSSSKGAAAMARDGEQRAMTAERLAEIRQMADDLTMARKISAVESVAYWELLTEVERLRAALAAHEALEAALAEKLDAETDYSAGRVERLLAREATLVAYVAGMATFSPAARIEDIQRQIIAARALLAAQADDAARGEQKGQ